MITLAWPLSPCTCRCIFSSTDVELLRDCSVCMGALRHSQARFHSYTKLSDGSVPISVVVPNPGKLEITITGTPINTLLPERSISLPPQKCTTHTQRTPKMLLPTFHSSAKEGNSLERPHESFIPSNDFALVGGLPGVRLRRRSARSQSLSTF